MKSTLAKALTVITAVLLFTGATAWEGVTSVDASIRGTYCVATNSFPRNSVVDIINLENGKMVRVRVVSGLETTGLLATLSPSAADAIGLRAKSTGRIRMTQPPDDIAFSNYRLGPIAPPAETPPAVTAAPAASPTAAALPTTPPATPSAATAPAAPPAAAAAPVTTPATAADPASVPAASPASAAAPEPAPGPVPEDGAAVSRTEAPDGATADPAPITGKPILVSADEKLPEGTQPVLPPENFIPPIQPLVDCPDDALAAAPETVPEFVPPIADSPAPVSSAVPESASAAFQAPLVDTLEKGMWYVQVAAYARVDHAEDEIGRIGTAYPVAIQNAGNETKPMFRVLLGPLNQGESGAMLQRLQSIGYKDAFIRQN